MISYDSSAAGTLNIVEGEIKGSSLDDLTVDLKVNDDVKAEIKASVKEVVVTINHGSLSLVLKMLQIDILKDQFMFILL